MNLSPEENGESVILETYIDVTGKMVCIEVDLDTLKMRNRPDLTADGSHKVFGDIKDGKLFTQPSGNRMKELEGIA